MAPPNAPETLRKALAMGATRGVHVTDPALGGSCAVSTARSWPRPSALEFDLVLAGVDTSDGVGGVVPAAIAAHLGLPYPVHAARIEPDEAPAPFASAGSRRPATTCSRRRCPASSPCTQALGEPRYPSLKGIMAARSKEIADPVARRPRPRSGGVGGAVATTTVLGTETPPARGATEVVRGSARRGRRQDRRVPRGAAARLMGAHLDRRRSRARRRPCPDQRRGRHARPRARGRGRSRRGRHRRRAPIRDRSRSELAALRAGCLVRGGSFGRRPRLVGGRGRPHRRAPRAAATAAPERPMRSSSGPDPTDATSPARSRR